MEVTLKPLLETLRLENISDKIYFGNKYSSYISNSRMKLINKDEGGSPELYDKGFGSSQTDSLLLGSAFHAHYLSPDEFDIVQCSRPNAKLGFFIDSVFKYRKEGLPIWKCVLLASISADYYKNKLTDRIVRQAIAKGLDYYLFRLHHKSEKEVYYLGNDLYGKYKSCVDSFKRNTQIIELLNPSTLVEPAKVFNEYTILMDIEATLETGEKTILKLKAKLDNFTINQENGELVLNDLKTTGKPLYKFRNHSFQDYHYYRQASFYAWLLQLAATHIFHFDYKKFFVNFLVVSTIPDYRCGIFRCPQDQIAKGWEEMKRLLKQIAIHQVCKNDLSRTEFIL